MVDFNDALVTQFSDSVIYNVAQTSARLKPYVDVRQMTGDNWFIDSVGSVEARLVTGRNVAATFDDIDHTRRKISKARYVVNLPIDASDVRGSLLDPQSVYAKRCAEAIMRQWDRIIVTAAFADVYTGRNGDTLVTAATDGVTTVDATAGLTYAKLLEVHENFIDDNVGLDMNESLLGTITGSEHTALMQEAELTSGDFTRDYAIEKGQLVRATGIDLIKFAANDASPILPVSGGVRDLLFAAKGAVIVGLSKDMTIKIQERNDLIETTQVQVIFELGAVREQGVKVQKVQVTA